MSSPEIHRPCFSFYFIFYSLSQVNPSSVFTLLLTWIFNKVSHMSVWDLEIPLRNVCLGFFLWYQDSVWANKWQWQFTLCLSTVQTNCLMRKQLITCHYRIYRSDKMFLEAMSCYGIVVCTVYVSGKSCVEMCVKWNCVHETFLTFCLLGWWNSKW